MSDLEKAKLARTQAEQAVFSATPENRATREAAVLSAGNAEASAQLNEVAAVDRAKAALATKEVATSEKPAVEATNTDAAMLEASNREVAAALAAAQEATRQEAARQEVANREKAQAEVAKQERAAAEKAAQQEADRKAKFEEEKQARAARREAKLKGMGRTSVRIVTDAWGMNRRKIITTYAPTPKTDEARAANRVSAAAKVRAAKLQAQLRKETAALAAKVKKNERVAGRMEHLHGRKGITVERALAVEREMKSSQAARLQEASPERVVAPPQPVREQPQREPAAGQQAAPLVAQNVQPAMKGPGPEATAKIADIDAEKMAVRGKIAEHQNQKANIEARKLSPREFAESLAKSPQQGQEAGKSKALNKGKDLGAGM